GPVGPRPDGKTADLWNRCGADEGGQGGDRGDDREDSHEGLRLPDVGARDRAEQVVPEQVMDFRYEYTYCRRTCRVADKRWPGSDPSRRRSEGNSWPLLSAR